MFFLIQYRSTDVENQYYSALTLFWLYMVTQHLTQVTECCFYHHLSYDHMGNNANNALIYRTYRLL